MFFFIYFIVDIEVIYLNAVHQDSSLCLFIYSLVKVDVLCQLYLSLFSDSGNPSNLSI